MIEVFVSDLLNYIVGVSQRIYDDLASDLSGVLYSIAAIIIVLMIVNHILQIRRITFGAYVGWTIRAIIIISAASSWAFFEPIYNGVIALPDGIAAAILGGGATVFGAIDAVLDSTWEIAANSYEDGGWTDPGPALVGFGIWIIGGLLGAVAMLVAVMAYVGLALALGLAPVFISALLVDATKDLFAQWTKFVIGFVMVLVILAGVVGLSLEVFQETLRNVETEGDLASWGQFLVAVLVMIFLMTSVPRLAQSVAGAAVTAGAGIAAASGVAADFRHYMGAASNALQGGGEMARRGVSRAASLAQSPEKRAEIEANRRHARDRRLDGDGPGGGSGGSVRARNAQRITGLNRGRS